MSMTPAGAHPESLTNPAGIAEATGGTATAVGLPITADLHSHTSCSHGQADARTMYASARAHGLKTFGFSEHSPRPDGYSYPEDYQAKLLRCMPDYLREVEALKEEGLAAGMQILLGMELDYCSTREDFARELVASRPFDYIIGGLHFQDTWGFDFTAEDWERLDQKARYSAYARYYQDLASMCRMGIFQVAAHPDLIKIFSIETFRAWLETPEALPLVRTALTAVRDNGMLMEISSAGLRKPCNEIYPGPVIMKLAAELGVPISFGSDAHCPNTPAFAFDLLARYAHSFGYTQSFVVVQGKRSARPFSPSPAL
jgi:histidinol-phosphatase (PHP family)